MHLQSEEPLFHQLAAHGGSGLLSPLPLMVAEVGYGMVVRALGLDSLSPEDQVKELLRMPHAEFEAKTRNVPAPISAWIDGDIVRQAPTYGTLANAKALEELYPGIKWCPSIWMGTCSFDVSI